MRFQILHSLINSILPSGNLGTGNNNGGMGIEVYPLDFSGRLTDVAYMFQPVRLSLGSASSDHKTHALVLSDDDFTIRQ